MKYTAVLLFALPILSSAAPLVARGEEDEPRTEKELVEGAHAVAKIFEGHVDYALSGQASWFLLDGITPNRPTGDLDFGVKTAADQAKALGLLLAHPRFEREDYTVDGPKGPVAKVKAHYIASSGLKVPVDVVAQGPFHIDISKRIFSNGVYVLSPVIQLNSKCLSMGISHRKGRPDDKDAMMLVRYLTSLQTQVSPNEVKSCRRNYVTDEVNRAVGLMVQDSSFYRDRELSTSRLQNPQTAKPSKVRGSKNRIAGSSKTRISASPADDIQDPSTDPSAAHGAYPTATPTPTPNGELPAQPPKVVSSKKPVLSKLRIPKITPAAKPLAGTYPKGKGGKVTAKTRTKAGTKPKKKFLGIF